MSNELKTSGLKLPRVEFNGTNYTKWRESLILEGQGNGVAAFFYKEINDKIN